MRIVQFHKVLPTRRPDAYEDANPSYTETDEPGENQHAAQSPAPVVPDTAPVAVNVDAIRCFYPRHAERGPGTRLTFKDGGGFAVTELYDEVFAAVTGGVVPLIAASNASAGGHVN